MTPQAEATGPLSVASEVGLLFIPKTQAEMAQPLTFLSVLVPTDTLSVPRWSPQIPRRDLGNSIKHR